MNDSDTEVRQLVFRSTAAEYTDYSRFNTKTNNFATVHAATPSPVVVEVSVPAHTEQDVDFQTCTTTRSPGSDYQLDITPAYSQEVVWSTGDPVNVCFLLGCG